jgi:competence protein ComEA
MTRHLVAGALALAIVTLLPASPLAQQTSSSQTAPAPASPINLNTATAADLEKLPGVGPATAARIIEYRQKNGNFKKAEELMNVQGIGEKTFLKLKSLVTVAPPKLAPRVIA